MLPRILLLCAVIIWGWTFIATKVLVAEISPVEILALRLAIGLPFLGGVLLVKRVPLRLARADVQPLLLGAAIFTLHVLIQALGLISTTATNTGWIIAVSPLALAVLSFVFLREGIGWNGVAGLYLYLEALATLTLAVPFLGEPFGSFIVIGGGLVLWGVYLGQRERPA